jgi:hypothetical protein
MTKMSYKYFYSFGMEKPLKGKGAFTRQIFLAVLHSFQLSLASKIQQVYIIFCGHGNVRSVKTQCQNELRNR